MTGGRTDDPFRRMRPLSSSITTLSLGAGVRCSSRLRSDVRVGAMNLSLTREPAAAFDADERPAYLETKLEDKNKED